MRRLLFAFITCAVALLTSATALAVPEPALAADGSYSIDELSTRITVETNASIRVTERQILTFADHSRGVTWYLHALEDGESVRISSVRSAPVDDGGAQLGDWTRLQMVDSDPDRQGAQPGDSADAALRAAKVQPWYSYDIGDGMIRCYFPVGTTEQQRESASRIDADDGTEGASLSYIVETEYTIAHRVRVFRDVAELYWRYADASLPADANEVNLQVNLPVPEGTDPETVRNGIRAWGHGPDTGTFVIGEDGTVAYHIDEISSGNYAEAHIVFPAGWMTDVTPGSANQFSELRGAAADAEETEWVDTQLREAAWDNMVRVLFLVIALLVVLVGAVGVFHYGRSPRSRRTLVRVSATLAIVAAGESLFFREPITTALLALIAAIVLATAFLLPREEDPEQE